MKAPGIVFALLIAVSLSAQDDPDLRVVPVSGLPPGSRAIAYSILAAEPMELLVAEVEAGDGVIAFYLFDYVEDTLVARLLGPRSIPGDLSALPSHRPVTGTLNEPGVRYWTVSGSTGGRHAVNAPSLDQLLFEPTPEGPWQLSPHDTSPLAIRKYTLGSAGAVVDECLLEPNIIAARDRMSTIGAWRVVPYGEPHLLLGMLFVSGQDGRVGGLRLYNEDGEIVASTVPRIGLDANVLPDLLLADLSGDGEQEIVFFSTDELAAEPVAVYRYVRRDGGRRVLAFNLCSQRMSGPDVRELQIELRRMGYDLGPHGVDGWYGPDTRAAVIRFQRDVGIPVTGIVDRSVWTLLGLDEP